MEGARRVLEPATPLVRGRRLEAFAEYLSAVGSGQIKRLIINCPPRLGKSSIVAIAWPSWEWAKDDATSRWVFASCSASLSVKHNVDRRMLIGSEWYSNLWPKVRLSRDANLKQEFVSRNRGHMFATSVGGSTTGKG